MIWYIPTVLGVQVDMSHECQRVGRECCCRGHLHCCPDQSVVRRVGRGGAGFVAARVAVVHAHDATGARHNAEVHGVVGSVDHPELVCIRCG